MEFSFFKLAYDLFHDNNSPVGIFSVSVSEHRPTNFGCLSTLPNVS